MLPIYIEDVYNKLIINYHKKDLAFCVLYIYKNNFFIANLVWCFITQKINSLFKFLDSIKHCL